MPLYRAHNDQGALDGRLQDMYESLREARKMTQASREHNRKRLAAKANTGDLKVGDSVVILAQEPLTLTSRWDPRWFITQIRQKVIWVQHQPSGAQKILNRNKVRLVDPDMAWDAVHPRPHRQINRPALQKGRMRRPARPGQGKGPATPQPGAQPPKGPPGQAAVHESSAPSKEPGEPAKSAKQNVSERAQSGQDEQPRLQKGGQSTEQGEKPAAHPPTDMEQELQEPVQDDPMQEDQQQPASDLDSPMEGQATAPPPKHPIGPEGGEELPAPKRRRVFLPRAAKESPLMDQSD